MKKINFITVCLILMGSQYLCAQNWVLQHPNYEPIQLTDIAFNEEGDGVAIGRKGLVMRSTDWGSNWQEAIVLPAFQELYDVSFAPGSDVVYIAGNSKTYKSTDAGVNWQPVDFGISFGASRIIQVVSEDELFVTNKSKIIHSTDGGVNWTDLGEPIGIGTIQSMVFHDSNTGWLGSTQGGIYKTTDGGQNWEVMDTTQFNTLVNLRFLNDQTGFAAIQKKLAKTTDGGQNWTVINENAFGNHIDDLAIINDSTIVATQNLRAYYSEQGGTVVNFFKPAQYADDCRGIYALPDGRVWLACGYRSILYSNDFGLSYDEQVDGNHNRMQYVGFLTDQKGWTVGQGASLLKTDNAGDNWVDVSPADLGLSSVFDAEVVSDQELWMCGGSTVAKSTDGGANWNVVLSGIGSPYKIEITSNAVYVGTSGGKIYQSFDGGDNFETVEIAASNVLFRGLCFPTGQTGYAAGSHGVFVKTTDAGTNWDTLPFPSGAHLLDVFFIDENTGWVSVDNFSTELYYTEDGGQNWTTQTLPASGYWYEIKFINKDYGIAAGGSSGIGRVLETTDGGNTWEQVYLADEIVNGLEVLDLQDSIHIWICGPGGYVIRGTKLLTSSAFTPEKNLELGFYPNPSNGIFQLDIPFRSAGNSILQVFNLQGQLIQILNNPSKTLNLTDVPNGIYLLRLTADGKVYQGKVILQSGN